MRQETKAALLDLIVLARVSGDPNAGEAARVVERDLLCGGQSTQVQQPAPPPVVWVKKPKARK